MSFVQPLTWIVKAIPRAPKRAGLLMRLYYRWQENFMPAGHAAAALLMFSMFVGMVPGFWAAWIFCGIDFLFILTLVPSLFLTSRKNKVMAGEVVVPPAFEGGETTLTVTVTAANKMDAVSVGCFRMDPSIKCEEPDLRPLAMGEVANLQCRLRVGNRGAYLVPKVAVIVPEVQGMLRYATTVGKAELLVFPRPVKILSFSFLTSGASGVVFAPLLMPSLMRGMDFVGVREYREGDSLRDLHHKAFARYGRPFTKEFETERGAGAVLVLDTTARGLREKMNLEPLVRLAAGIGLWLLERGTLGRFFIGNEEVPLVSADGGVSLLESLARIPRAGLYRQKAPPKKTWSPAARPTGPVLRLGLEPELNALVHKQIVVDVRHGAQPAESPSDDVLFLHSVPAEVSL